MTPFARAEEERIFLERCYRLYERIERVKARVDNKVPKCMFGSYLGKQNELRKQLTSAGSTATGSSGASGGWDMREFTLLEDATIEQKIEHFLILANYKRIPSSPKKRFPYLRRMHKVEPSQPVPVDLMELHASAFTSSYPRIVRRAPTTESKLRHMPLFYQKPSVSSEEASASGNTPDQTETRDEEETSKSDSSATSSASSASENASSGSSKTDNPADARSDAGSDSGSSSSSQGSHHSKAPRSASSTSSNSSKSSERQQAAPISKPSTASAVSTITSSSSKAKKPQQGREISNSTASSIEERPRPSKANLPTDKRSKVVLRIPSEDAISASPSVRRPDSSESQASPIHSARSGQGAPDEVSNADTTHDVPPMESENSVFNEEFDAYVDFLNDVTDVVLGMGVFSPSAIQAAIDAALATNVYGDVDRERAQTLVEQLFS